MLKLVQEIREHAMFPQPRLPAQAPGALLLDFEPSQIRNRKSQIPRTLPITIREPVDIPYPVAIRHVTSDSAVT